MIIKTQVTFKEYAKLLLTLAYRQPVMIILVGVTIVNGTWIICYHFDILNLPEPKIYQYFAFLLISVIQPLGIFFMIWRNYFTSTHLQETLELHLTKDQIKLNADGFSVECLWSKMYKIIELKHWFVIYQNNISAIIIPKKTFQYAEIEDFKQILLVVKETKVKLRKPV